MKFNYNKERKKKRAKCFFLLVLCCITFISIFKNLEASNIEYNNENLVVLLINKTTKKNKSIIKETAKHIIKDIYINPNKHLLQMRSNLIKKEEVLIPVINESSKYEPIIYIYNTHQTEEYKPSDFIEYSIKPTVTMANYIMEETFKNNNYQVLVETASVKEILNKNNWNYSYSYRATRFLLEEQKQKNPSLKYFIDVHRDSVPKEKTTTIIDGKNYAKLLFVLGLENPNFQQNLSFIEEIDKCLNLKYPSLSKGIYKKSGYGVNGIYNQDFSPYTILIEVGGYENTTNEVLNSSIAFATCFTEVITLNESKTNS